MSARIRTAIFGANGKVGHELVERLTPDHDLFPFTRENGDLRYCNVANLIEGMDVVINATAMNGMENVEHDPIGGLLVNGVAPGALAAACKSQRALFIHYSTDYVFSGDEDGLFEGTATKPIGAYGWTKLIGEQSVQRAGEFYFIFRLSSIFGREYSGPLDVVNQVVKKGRGTPDDPVQVLHQLCAPTSARLVADATAAAIDVYYGAFNRKSLSGIYHLATAEPVWKKDHAQGVLWKVLGPGPSSDEAIRPWHVVEGKLAVERPVHSFLNSDKFQATFDYRMPTWREDLALTMPLLPPIEYPAAK